MENECRVPYCHRKPWGDLRQCKKHTLYSRQAMQDRRDRDKVAALEELEGKIAITILSRWQSQNVNEVARNIISMAAAYFGRTRRRQNG